ncbi:MAG: ABC transporter ATP-binding protein [Planctomycetia bacterium]|nr:ABC transporter ATP-binding protein [Planctomycetia bacterium]
MIRIAQPEIPQAPPGASPSADLLVEACELSKKYCRNLKRSMLYGGRDILAQWLRGYRCQRLRPGEFWALKNVSLQLRRGEALGIVGPNGAGKTTLLRIIAGVIRPDVGEVRNRGRIAPLLSLGAGFNPVLSGRENIWINLSILGLGRRQIRARFDDIIQFAELESAIEAPVRTYSSGMKARLGFACAVHTQPDVLLVDEVLAVGDITFRGKCYRRLAEMRAAGTAFILVSHSPHSVLSICDHGIYLNQGRCRAAGAIHAVMAQYESDVSKGAAAPAANRLDVRPAETGTGLRIASVFFRGGDGEVTSRLQTGRPITFCIRCDVALPLERITVALIIRDSARDATLTLNLSGIHDDAWLDVAPGECELRMSAPQLGLRPGVYLAKAVVVQGALTQLDGIENFQFRVEPGLTVADSTFYQPHTWQVVPIHQESASAPIAMAG